MTSVGAIPILSGGYGPDQKLTWGNTVDSVGPGEFGVRLQFDVAGRFSRIEYRRSSAASSQLFFTAWRDNGTVYSTLSQDTQTTTGLFTVTLGAPVAVTAGLILTFSLNAGIPNNAPRNATTAAPTNTTDLTFLEYRFNGTVNTYPSTVVTTRTYFITPIFEPAL